MFLEHDEMKFAILYTLEKYVEPITMPDLCDILTWEKQVMNYFDVALMLNELIEDDFIKSTYYRDEHSFMLTELGKETNSFFFERVPNSIRKRIDDAISTEKFEEQYNPNSVECDIEPVAPHQYMSHMTMLDANVPMLELKLHTGSRLESEKALKKLEKKSDEIYKFLIGLISEDA